jgi:hypothetical protein
MGKRGPKPSSPNGEPKKRVTMALASDVIAWMYSHKPMVPWLESLMRDAMRAEGFRNFGDALRKDYDAGAALPPDVFVWHELLVSSDFEAERSRSTNFSCSCGSPWSFQITTDQIFMASFGSFAAYRDWVDATAKAEWLKHQ